MKIIIINGSPKLGDSTSELMIQYLTSAINGHEIISYNVNRAPLTEAQFDEMKSSDALVFAFPLYVDSIPAHLLRVLIDIEKQEFLNPQTLVYCIINNGFFEGHQNHIAVEQMKLWCEAAHLTWGQAIGVGAGEMLPLVKNIPLGYGPNKNIGNAIKTLSKNITTAESGTDIFISPNWPRFLWRFQGSIMFWYPRAKANGLNMRKMRRRIDRYHL